MHAAQLSFWFFGEGTPASLTTEIWRVLLPTEDAAEASIQMGEQIPHCARHSFIQSLSGGAGVFTSTLAEAGGAGVGVNSAAFGGGAL